MGEYKKNIMFLIFSLQPPHSIHHHFIRHFLIKKIYFSYVFFFFLNKYVKLVIKGISFYRSIMNNVDINLIKNKNFSRYFRDKLFYKNQKIFMNLIFSIVNRAISTFFSLHSNNLMKLFNK